MTLNLNFDMTYSTTNVALLNLYFRLTDKTLRVILKWVPVGYGAISLVLLNILIEITLLPSSLLIPLMLAKGSRSRLSTDVTSQ